MYIEVHNYSVRSLAKSTYVDSFITLIDQYRNHPNTMPNIVNENPHARIILAIQHKKIIGTLRYCSVDEQSRLSRFAPATYINMVYTHPEYRNCGIAKALFKELFSTVDGRKILEVDSTNAPAIGLYKSLGFTVVETGEDLIMSISEN